MKKTRILLLLPCLLIPALAVAQTSRMRSNEGQQLRRYKPEMQNTEQDFGQDKLSVSFEKGIPLSTEQALIGYVTQHYKIAQLMIDIYKLPGADNLYFLTGTVHKDQQSQETSVAQTVFLVLREQGGTVSEVSKAENESDAAIKEPVFFHGQNKLLIIVSLSAPDGSLAGHYAYEYADDNLKPLGDIPVIDKLGMSGQVWITNNRIEAATAEYKNNAYYMTVRGKGTLYQEFGYDNYKKLAPPRSPVTFFHDGKEWRPVATRRVRRR